LRLVLDTNVLIAAFVARGMCHELLEYCQRRHDLVSSAILLDEFEDKLTGKFKVPAAEASEARSLIEAHSQLVAPDALEAPVCRDPDDDWVLATALAGACACVVTGDNNLLVIEQFRGMLILPPAAFWSYEAGPS
jgi:putative PIN family toxin of toxin-antitoxin system